MNNTVETARAAVLETARLTADAEVGVVLCVPFTDITACVEAARGSKVKIGAQNVHWEKKGAFTGEISADMLAETGAEYVIIGHSERRQYFGETDETVNARVKAALAAGFTVILCVGEVKEQRLAGITHEVLGIQMKLDLAGVTAEELSRIVIAYEPVWAIGTGLVATPEQAEDACRCIREIIAGLYGAAAAAAMTIQYGGSMNETNAKELLACPDIDGGLIGGASLVPEKFAKIVAFANEG
jgi:triosephosphate isomerase